MARIPLKGTPHETVGELPSVGSPAPEFHLVDGDLNDVRLGAYKGKRKSLTINPSFDTAVCATAARKFNEQAAALDNGVVLAISADLPFAQKRFCTAEGLDHVIPLSMMRSKNFAKDYGVLIQDGPLAGVTARAIVVVNENDEVVHTQLVEEVTEEPDYAAALNSIR